MQPLICRLPPHPAHYSRAEQDNFIILQSKTSIFLFLDSCTSTFFAYISTQNSSYLETRKSHHSRQCSRWQLPPGEHCVEAHGSRLLKISTSLDTQIFCSSQLKNGQRLDYRRTSSSWNRSTEYFPHDLKGFSIDAFKESFTFKIKLLLL